MKKMDFEDLFVEVKEVYPYREEYVFYIDKNLEIPYNGIVLDYFKGVINWEFEVKDGFIDGIERIYYEETGELYQENEIKHYLIDGLAKEFYKSGTLHTISIVIKDIFIYSIWYDKYGNITQKNYLSNDELSSNSYNHIRDKIDSYIEKYKHIKELCLN